MGPLTSESLSSPEEELEGLVSKIIFHNADNGYSVFEVTSDQYPHGQVIVGHHLVAEGEQIKAFGHWEQHKFHGSQFKAHRTERQLPKSLQAIEKYLGSGTIKGIGEGHARKLTKAFGDKVLEVIEHSPEKIQALKGFGAKKVALLQQGIQSQKSVQDLMLFLHPLGIGSARAMKLYKKYGDQSLHIIQTNPYRLVSDLKGVGFVLADRLALGMGIEKTSSYRIQAGIHFLIQDSISKGHCGIRYEALCTQSEELLGIALSDIEIIIQQEMEVGTLIALEDPRGQLVFNQWLFDAQHRIAQKLHTLACQSESIISVEPAALTQVEADLGIEFSNGQLEALMGLNQSKVLVVTGGPGVGKTSLIKAMVKLLASESIALCAPTGRAAKRMEQATGVEAKTIHRLLGSTQEGRFTYDENFPLPFDGLIVDEMSMVDVPLMDALLKAIKDDSFLILVGDVDQLPSVGPGQVLKDLIESKRVQVVRLTEIFRQAKTSQIIQNAHRINQGQMPYLESKDDDLKDFFFIGASEWPKTLDNLVQVVTHRIPNRFNVDPIEDIQVLCPMHKGTLGTAALNERLQKELNGTRLDEGHVIQHRQGVLALGDKVIQTQNNYDKGIFNGDLGQVVALDPGENQLTISFDGLEHRYEGPAINELSLAYALSIHKSQGSEYPVVVLPISMQHFVMLKRNLLYTAITRATRLVVILGEKRALGMACGQADSMERLTSLVQQIQALSPESSHDSAL